MSTGRIKVVGNIANLEKLELQRLRAKVERLVAALDEAIEEESSESYDSFAPSVDICENEKVVMVWVELPGVTADRIEISATAKEITLEGDKMHSPSNEKASHLCCERRYGRFHRRILLRWPVNINDISASLRDGVLAIKIPKLIDRRGKAVKVDVVTEETAGE